ncbi:hypothetical protein L1049_001462 [Liquidambar formosana]|uniref:Uncharacterized protein n=1 Tax=Liquidambar formosana TaxID=63359 RepID=A0AAP0R681_LIQFO
MRIRTKSIQSKLSARPTRIQPRSEPGQQRWEVCFHSKAKLPTVDLARLGWKMLTEPISLWASVFRGKYLQSKSFFDCTPKSHSSHSWRSILQGREIFRAGMKWVVGNGRNINFWSEVWVGDSALCEIVVSPIPESELKATVWDYSDDDGNWDWYRFEHLLPHFALEQIRAIHPFKDLETEDSFCWKSTPNGKFSMHSAYSFALDHRPCPEEKHWSRLWQCKCPPKLRYFL